MTKVKEERQHQTALSMQVCMFCPSVCVSAVVSNPKHITTGCSLTAVCSQLHPCLFITFIKLKFEEWGGGERKRGTPVSWPRCLAQMFAAMRRRQPQERIDYDSVSADNEPVTRTGPWGRQGASQHFPQRSLARCCFGAAGREAWRRSL